MLSDPIVVTAVAGSATVAAIVDLKTRRVPNWLTLGIAAIGISMAVAHLDGVSPLGALEGLAVGLLLMLPGHAIGRTGAGDVKLLAAVGTMLGPQAVMMAFLYTAIAGGALAVLVAIGRGSLRRTIESTATLMRTGGANAADIEKTGVDNRFAYAPAIAAGALVAAIWR